MKESRGSWIARTMSAVIAGCLCVSVLLCASQVRALAQEGPEDGSEATAQCGGVAPRDPDSIREGLAAMGLSGVPENVIQTLATLVKISDYPIYTMHYYGPYIRASELQAQYGSQAVRTVEYPLWACSLFAAVGDADAPMFGRNFDWEVSPLLVVFLEPEVGYRSVMSVDLAYLFDEETVGRLDTATVEEILPILSAPSVTFDGMNEMGLAIGMASVDYECGYPSDPDKRDVGDLKLMREVLESSATVDEALAFLEGINPVSQGGPNSHYLLADRTPAAALVEYDNGKMYVFRSTTETPWQLGTNFPVVLAQGRPQGRCWRYDRIEQALRDQEGDLSSADVLELLEAVSTPMTQWSIVYDLTKLMVFLSVDRGYQDVFGVSLLEGITTLQHPDDATSHDPERPDGDV